jgi:hypothetical protein
VQRSDDAAPAFELYRPERDLTRAQLIDELAAMPARLRAVVARRDAAALQRPLDDGWSALQVCRHMRDIVQVYGIRFKWMVLADDPFLPNYDEDRWVEESPDTVGDLDAVLREIAAYRAETVRLLRSLDDDGWRRTGRHETIGALVLEPYVRHEYAHEEQHLAQLQRALDAG